MDGRGSVMLDFRRLQTPYFIPFRSGTTNTSLAPLFGPITPPNAGLFRCSVCELSSPYQWEFLPVSAAILLSPLSPLGAGRVDAAAALETVWCDNERGCSILSVTMDFTSQHRHFNVVRTGFTAWLMSSSIMISDRMS
jgi:hypothetical protein